MLIRSGRWVWLLLLLVVFLITTAGYRSRFLEDIRVDNGAAFDTKEYVGSPANFSKALVVGHRERDNISWIESLPANINRCVYVIGNATASPTLPANKGREAMVYLTYIIDNYPNFPDIVLFFHPNDIAWHNNVLLNNSTRETIARLSAARVMRAGYFNSRCHSHPGCTQWLHFDVPKEPLPNFTDWRNLKGPPSKLLGEKPEERYLTSTLWRELHPGMPVPQVLSQAAGAQFAVSGKRIVSRPKSDYLRWRDWLLKTELHDRDAGRIMEYMRRYIFTGQSEVCLSEHECLCDGYGICFEDEGSLRRWYALRERKKGVDEEIYYLRYNASDYVNAVSDTLHEKSRSIGAQLQILKEKAFRRGGDPRVQALATGRSWMQADAD